MSYLHREEITMKRCQKCNFQSDAMLDYCWQCGSQLIDVPNAGNYYQGAQATQGFNYHAQNNYVPNQTRNFNNYQQNQAPNYQPRANSVSFGRIAAVLASVFLFVLLVSGAGAVVVYKVINKPPVRYYDDDYPPRKPEPVKPSEPVKNDPVKETEPVKTNPSDDKPKSDKASAEFEKMWVDYNVTENGRLGMRIHAKFTVHNLKGVDSYMAIYFEKADGTILKSTDKGFSSKDGRVAVYRSMKPGYEDTIYKDLDVFMPYDQLKLSRGKYNLKMDVDVIYENGGLVEHMNYYEFEYEKFRQ